MGAVLLCIKGFAINPWTSMFMGCSFCQAFQNLTPIIIFFLYVHVDHDLYVHVDEIAVISSIIMCFVNVYCKGSGFHDQ